MVWDFGVSKELKLVENVIRGTISSDEPLLTDIASYVIGSGGKRIRPTVTLLAYKALGGTDTEKIVEISAAYELIHNATLIHDDINDGGSLRRGKLPAHKKYGVHCALVTGDYLFVKGFRIGGRFETAIVDITADACSKLAEGEIKQKSHRWDIALSKAEYLEIIKKKTAMPIQAGAMVGAYLANGSLDAINALGDYGLNLGMGFQIVDDILDVVGDGSKMGKDLSSDVREGNMTLISILALEALRGSRRRELEGLLEKRRKTAGDLRRATALIRDTSAVEASRREARIYSDRAKRALEFLKNKECKRHMTRLADYVLNREC